jgi:uncharacterized protein YkwD
LVKKVFWSLLCLCLILWLAACSSTTATHTSSSSYRLSDSLNQDGLSSTDPDATAILTIPSQKATPTPVPHNTPSSTSPSRPTPTPQPGSSCITFSNDTTLVPPKNGTLAAPYGPAPVTAEAQQLTTQLFQLINSDRAACGLPPFAWNATLASGALLHSWNMIHCGFSHYCPDGMTPYQRIANEGFAGRSDCGENIGEAGPYPTPWAGVYAIQESMAHEPLGGWHRIHLFSTTLHQIGIGVSIDANGYIWFTEDMTS